MLRQSASDGTIVVHGDGNQTRDYVYRDDVVTAMVSAATAPEANQRIINVGSGRETSVRELVRLVNDATGGRPEVVYNQRVDAGPDRMCADIRLAQETLDYHPVTPLEMGLRITLEQDARLRGKK